MGKKKEYTVKTESESNLAKKLLSTLTCIEHDKNEIVMHHVRFLAYIGHTKTDKQITFLVNV